MCYEYEMLIGKQISQCEAHISELNLHAEAQASEYKQKVCQQISLSDLIFQLQIVRWQLQHLLFFLIFQVL